DWFAFKAKALNAAFQQKDVLVSSSLTYI
ncbi:hypothetical protein JOC55_006384, partial [Paenibacillus sacheonensis]|nr:hypothetical protein [Paenibacillus sacheonensis]